MVGEIDKRANDSRIILYRSLKQIVVIIVAGLFVKSCMFDSIVVKDNQMSPTLISGDRTLIFRFPYLPIIRTVFRPALGKPVIFNYSFEKKCLSSSRIAGLGGDTVFIDSGRFVNSRSKKTHIAGVEKNAILVPASYSPRDFFLPYVVPEKGARFTLDSLTLRDFFFVTALVRQENPGKKIGIKADLYIDDSLSNDYFVNEFSLWKGTIDTVPEKYQFDWLFWDRLRDYLTTANQNHSIVLKFSLTIDGKRISQYTVKENYIFLIADNWSDGLDSRYFGPVRVSSILGRTFFVLWSYDKTGHVHLKFNRFGRIVR